jgi:protein disulfide-isomerase
MVRLTKLSVATIVLATWCGVAQGADTRPSIVWNQDLSAAKKAVEQRRPVLLYLTMPGCTYCQKMKAETFAQKSIVKRISAEYVPVELKGRTNSEMSRLLQVRVYPTTAFIASDGKVVDIVHGYKSPSAFAKRMAAAQAKIRMSRGEAKDAPTRR